MKGLAFSMEQKLLQPMLPQLQPTAAAIAAAVLTAPLWRGEELPAQAQLARRLQVHRSSLLSRRAAGTEDMEVCGSLELTWSLPLDSMPSHKISLTLDNSKMPKNSLCDNSVFQFWCFGNQKPETWFLTCCSKYLHGKLFERNKNQTNKHTVGCISVCNATSMNKCVMERWGDGGIEQNMNDGER